MTRRISAKASNSLRVLRVLCVSVVNFQKMLITETHNTEEAQRSFLLVDQHLRATLTKLFERRRPRSHYLSRRLASLQSLQRIRVGQ